MRTRGIFQLNVRPERAIAQLRLRLILVRKLVRQVLNLGRSAARLLKESHLT